MGLPKAVSRASAACLLRDSASFVSIEQVEERVASDGIFERLLAIAPYLFFRLPGPEMAAPEVNVGRIERILADKVKLKKYTKKVRRSPLFSLCSRPCCPCAHCIRAPAAARSFRCPCRPSTLPI